ncbi:hypothetical protein HHX48_17705 [Salinimonas sp. HHU 13199]|uniref:Type IV secretion protein IcmB n=1 Tax=Salinimonas profundi TaxID=2729140 RepID=A0ABR8LT28_9ALTE|nr:hypothetical protein [Salinimonas profundi]MBD3587577.1 hypothetical protein [Salinimonas profundi]
MLYNHPNTFAERALSTWETLAQIVSSKLLKQSPKDHVSLDTVFGKHCLIQDDGSLISAIRIDGSRQVVGADKLDELVLSIEAEFKAYLGNGTHRIMHSFSMDTDKTEEELEQVFGANARKTAKNLGLIDTSLIDEYIQANAAFCHSERNYIVVQTKVRNLTPTESKELQKLKLNQAEGMPFMTKCQSIANGAEYYANKHLTLLDNLREMFRNNDIFCRLLDTHEITFDMRLAYDSAWTDLNYKVQLPGDNHSMELPESRKGDFSMVGVPKLADQIMSREMEIVESSLATVGDSVYAPLSVSFAPQKAKPFNILYRELKKADIPCRITFDMSADGISLTVFQETMASFLRITDKLGGTPNNKHIIEVSERLRALREAGEEIIQLRISICTWAYDGDVSLAKKRREQIARILQSWGHAESAQAEGDVVESVLSSIPGLTRGNSAKPLPYTLSDTISLLPITQPASVWESGSRIMRSIRGKIMPVQPYSIKQSHWTKMIVGPMGFGKTVELAGDNFSLLLHPDAQEIPYIRQIDIGPGSKGFVELVKSLLPLSKQHLAAYNRLQNTKENRINPMDTQLGLRYPLSGHRSTILNLVSSLTAQDDGSAPPEGTLDVINGLIDLAYKRLSERLHAHTYVPGLCEEVDEALEKYSFESEAKRPIWWDIVDFLYLQDEPRLASLAQRYAVPTVPYLNSLCSDPRIADEFVDAKTLSQEPITSYVSRKLRAAVNAYPILGGETLFDIGQSRIVSLDLDDVTKGRGIEGQRRTTLFYTLAYHVLTTDMYKGPDSLKEMEAEVGLYKIDYRKYHKLDVERLQRTVKRFCADEIHRGSEVPEFILQLITAVLEGRKWGVDVTLASQLADAFPADIKRLASSIIILGSGTAQNVKSIVEEFQLSPTMEYHLKNSLKKPSKRGATMLGIFDTDDGWLEQLMMSTFGPQFLWRVNSTRTDTYVVEQLAQRIGESEAMKLLVHRYPGGSLQEDIEARRKHLGIEEDFEEGVTKAGILDAIVADNMRYYKHHYIPNAA